MYSKSLGPRGRGPKVLGVLGPRPLGPWDLRYLGLKVWGPKVRGLKAQGLMALESQCQRHFSFYEGDCGTPVYGDVELNWCPVNTPPYSQEHTWNGGD